MTLHPEPLFVYDPEKCSVLTITNKKNPVKHNYLLHNHTLESVSSAKYLGITLQSDLKWTQHANNIVANANKSLGLHQGLLGDYHNLFGI
jgi:hypothetical protein